MVANIVVLQENLQRLEDLNAVMERMVRLERIRVSEACKSLADYMNANKDPLLFISHGVESPFLKKPKLKKRCLCF